MVLGRHDGDAHVLPEVAVIVVELERLDAAAAVLWRVPRKLYGVRRSRLPLQVGGLLRHCYLKQLCQMLKHIVIFILSLNIINSNQCLE